MVETSIFLTTLILSPLAPPQISLPASWQKVTWQPPAPIVQFAHKVHAEGIKVMKGAKEGVHACLLNYSVSRSQPRLPSELRGKIPETGFFILVDVNKNREYVFEDGELIGEYLISTGSATRFVIPQYTPLGTWQIIEKIKTNSNGEFGPYFLRLGKWDGKDFNPTSLALHGTNEPELLGKSASHGCIRHSNEVISHLYQILPIGTIVETVE